MAITFQYSSDGTTWTNLPTPASINGSAEDLDVDTFRAVSNGNLIRNIVSNKWQKFSIVYNYMNETDAASLMSILRTFDKIYVKINSPVVSTSGVTTIKCYCSKLSYNWKQTGPGSGGWNISFDLIEETR